MASTKPKERIFVPDGNWYLHRAINTLRTNRPIEVALPYHLLGMIVKDALRTKSHYLCVPFDGPEVFRYKVYPEYKANRDKDKQKAGSGAGVDAANAEPKIDVYQYLPHIFELFASVSIIFYQPKKHEADDVLNSVAKHYGGRYKVVCGTQDKDAYQYLNEYVRLFDASYKNKVTKESEPRYITAEMAERFKGVPVAQMVDYQTLIGDKIDNIPAIKGIGPAKAKAILAEYGSLSAWFKNGSKEDRRFLNVQMENLRRNRKLVQLVDNVLPPNELSEWKLPPVKSKDPYLSRAYHEYFNFLYPKSKGLFG